MSSEQSIKSLKGLDMTPLVSSKPKRDIPVREKRSGEILVKKVEQKQKQKTKQVNIYRTRDCMFGEECRYRTLCKPNGFHCDFVHTDEEYNTISRVVIKTYTVDDLSRTQPCWRGLECKVENCTYAHTPEQLVVRTCFKGGKCEDERCVFSHPQAKVDKKLIFEMMRENQKKPLDVKEDDILSQMRDLEVSEKESEDDVQVIVDTESLLKKSIKKLMMESKHVIWVLYANKVKRGVMEAGVMEINLKKKFHQKRVGQILQMTNKRENC